MNGLPVNPTSESVPNANPLTGIEINNRLPNSKICTACGRDKLLTEYHLHPRGRYGRDTKCKVCKNAQQRKLHAIDPYKRRAASLKWKKNNPEKCKATKRRYRIAHPKQTRESSRKWRLTHPEQAKELTRQWLADHPDQARATWKRYRTTHKEQVLAQTRLWCLQHPEQVRALHRKRDAKRRASIKGNLNLRISGGIRDSLINGKQGRHWETLVGYTLEQLKRHLEKQFKNEYSWENRHLWDIDHIVPKTAFHFETPEDIDFKKCWALKNLRPLWKLDNIKKSNKLEKPYQPSLLLEG